MDREKNYLRYIIFVLVMVIFLLVGYIMYTDNLFGIKDAINPSSKDVEEKKEEVITENTKNNDESIENEYIHSTTEKVKLTVANDYNIYANLTILDGKLLIETSKELKNSGSDDTYEKVSSEVALENEKIKYIFSEYDQRSLSTYVYALTENGNLYVNNFTASAEQKVDILNAFTKTEYTNVDELVKVENTNYGKESTTTSKAIDYTQFYLYVLIDGKLEKIPYQFEIFS